MHTLKVETSRAGALYRHPMELAYYEGLSSQQKRNMLAAWASKTNADATNPMLRRDSASGVRAHIDEIQEALRAIRDDAAHRAIEPYGKGPVPSKSAMWWERTSEGLAAAE